MQFSKFALFAAAAVPALAQDPAAILSDLPTGLLNYLTEIEANTAVQAAFAAIVTASQVEGVVQQILTGGADIDATAVIQSLEAAASNAIAAEPSDQQAVASSVIGVITSYAGAGLAQVTSSVGTTMAKSTSSHSASASASPSTGGAPQPTAMALGAFVGAVAGVAMML